MSPRQTYSGTDLVRTIASSTITVEERGFNVASLVKCRIGSFESQSISQVSAGTVLRMFNYLPMLGKFLFFVWLVKVCDYVSSGLEANNTFSSRGEANYGERGEFF